jgi:hypothetical protein
MAVPNIIQLRQLLAGKFPGLRTRADELAVRSRSCWATGLPPLDYRLGGGFAKAALTEVVAPRAGSGAASFAAHLLGHAAANGQFAALVDGSDSFDPGSIHPDALARLLWIRCRSADDALKATDILLRDGNLPVVIVDLAAVAEAQLRKIPAPAWYRFQRIIEERGVTGIFFTPRGMIAPAETRVTIEAHFDLAALDADREDLNLHFAVHESRRSAGHELLRQTA